MLLNTQYMLLNLTVHVAEHTDPLLKHSLEYGRLCFFSYSIIIYSNFIIAWHLLVLRFVFSHAFFIIVERRKNLYDFNFTS